MTSENLFESFINQELGDKVDDFSGGFLMLKNRLLVKLKSPLNIYIV